jgi:hypothetical protein
MRSPPREDTESTGQDSFLDVITNIVGILIILVMVVGARVQKIVIDATPGGPRRTAVIEQEIRDLQATLATAESDVEDLVAQGQQLAMEAVAADAARVELATAVAAATREIEARKAAADGDRVKAAEVSVRKKQLQADIEKTHLEAEGIAHAPATTEQVLAYPTPIGRTVTGEEIHFRLQGDRIAYIPLTELFELAKSQTRRRASDLAGMAARVESVGPEQDFWLDYVIEAKIDQARGQVLVRSREWVVRPSAPLVGETIAVALGSQSRFRSLLASAAPDTTVTLWCYPDGFEGYRKIREELHRMGIPTAGRPLPEGAPIGGSTEGSKSVMQ